jgi:putative CocE/NonD family hydrolase
MDVTHEGTLPTPHESKVSSTVAGVEPGQRQLNGPQTTGREFRNLSEPRYESVCDEDVAVPMRDGARLLADVHRPDSEGTFPVLVSASPYPRQVQDLGAPMGFIEAGASDFWVPRGYVHVIANVRGTGGSEGTFTMADPQERRDMHDLVEWAAAQPWCDGNVGMIGISYFATTQVEAAVEHAPHLKAIFPVALSPDFYDAVHHHGLFNSSFITPFLSMVGMTSEHGDEVWRSHLANAVRHVLHQPRLHEKFATMNGEASITILHEAMKLHHDPHPWDDLWRSVAVEHQLRDDFWDQRDVRSLLADVDIPVYLGCDWENVPLHLPGTFQAMTALSHNPNVRVALLDKFGMTWPWESLHIEALAWFDHWLKGHDTGIMEGPRIRYALPGADEWGSAEQWPPAGSDLVAYALGADGTLARGDGDPGRRSYMALGAGLGRAKPSPTDPPSQLTWTSEPLGVDLDVVGNIELRLDAIATAADTAWIATLQDIAPDGTAVDVTCGWLRATLRPVDEDASRPGAPVLPCTDAVAVPAGEVVHYRIPLVPNARRFAAGHAIRLVVNSDDQDPATPAIMGFRHASVGTSSLNTIVSSSRLLLPVIGDAGTAGQDEPANRPR